MKPDAEVLIVGAGPTGLMAAVLLTRCGITVRVFDKNTQQAHESRALAIQARTLELFLNLGLDRRMLDAGVIVHGAQMYENGQRRAELPFDDLGRTDTPFSFPLIVPQRDTEAILHDELRRLGVEVERQNEVTDLAQDADGVTLRVRGADGAETEARGAYLIGADGAHSLVRKKLGLTFAGAPYAQGFLLADCRVQWPLEDDRLMIFLKGKHIAIHFPLPGGEGRARIMAAQLTEPDAHATVESQGGTDAPLSEVEEAFRAAAGVDLTLTEPGWTSRYRVHHRGVDRYRVGRAFVAGDAAHIHSPAGGQGMNTGLQDAANLAWKLALALRRVGPATEGLLDTYHDERWPVGQRVLKYTDTLFSGMTSQSDWFAAARNFIAPRLAGSLLHFPGVRAKAFHFISQLGIHYKDDAPDPGKGPWKGGPDVGYRAPNASYARNRDVFGLLTGYRFHVLAFSWRALSSSEAAGICDRLAALLSPVGVTLQTHLVARLSGGPDARAQRAESGAAFEAYGVDHDTPQALYVIRPDGYVAWRSNTLDLTAAEGFLREYGSGSE